MTIVESLVKLLEDKGYGVFGQNIYLYRVPNSLKTETEIFWIIPSGGNIIRNYPNGDKQKMYQFLIYFRSNKAKRVNDVLSELEKFFNCAGCVELEGFELVNVSASSFTADQDLDSENRMVGMIQVQVEVLGNCE